MDLSIILPVLNESDNLQVLLPRLRNVTAREGLSCEILVIDGGSTDGTCEVATACGARVMGERRRGYGGALETGFAGAQGAYVMTLDADLSHEPDFVVKLWRARTRADIIIASRYTHGGTAYTQISRRFLSRTLNLLMRRALSMPVRDMSSGFRLYRREVLNGIELEGRNFEVLEEILVEAYGLGLSVHKAPGSSKGQETTHVVSSDDPSRRSILDSPRKITVCPIRDHGNVVGRSLAEKVPSS